MSHRRRTRGGISETTPMQVDLVIVSRSGKTVMHQTFPVDVPEYLLNGDYQASLLLNPQAAPIPVSVSSTISTGDEG